MLWGIFSDVHANYEALKAVFDFYEKKRVKRFICCGDIVGYGPEPEKCLRMISSLKDLVYVMGNHDAALCGKMDSKWFREAAREAIELNKKEISEEMLSFLRKAVDFVQSSRYTVVHGSPRNHLKEYMLTRSQFMENLDYWKISPCLFGHSHIPAFFEYNKTGNVLTTYDLEQISAISLKEENVYMLNPGSVGQPRDSNPKASCALYSDDGDKKRFEVFRIEYDIEKTRQEMEKKNYPRMFIDRLKFGI